MLVFETKYRSVKYFKDDQLIVNYWAQDTEFLTEDILKKDFIKYLQQVILIYKPQLIIHDLTELCFTVSPELQKWINENINIKAIECGAHKFGFIKPKDLFAQVSVQQAIDDNEHAKQDAFGYFNDIEDALEWIKNF